MLCKHDDYPWAVGWPAHGGLFLQQGWWCRGVYDCFEAVSRGVWLLFHLFFCDLHRFHADKEELLHLTELPKLHDKQQGRPPATLQIMLHQSSRNHTPWLADSRSPMANICWIPKPGISRSQTKENHSKYWVKITSTLWSFILHFVDLRFIYFQPFW